MAGFKVVVRGEFLNKVGEKDGGKGGRTTGLKVCPFVSLLLDQNNQHRLTDEALQAMLAAEFPKRGKVESASGGEGGLQTISAYRGWYNKQVRAGSGLRESHSYNSEGEVARKAPTPSKGKAKAKPTKGKASKAKPKAKAKATATAE